MWISSFVAKRKHWARVGTTPLCGTNGWTWEWDTLYVEGKEACNRCLAMMARRGIEAP